MIDDFSNDLTHWLPLPEVTPNDIKNANLLEGRFMGDPSFDHPIPKKGKF
jgi:hypothetical protein